MAPESLKLFHKCFGANSTESASGITFSERREVVENIPHASRRPITVNDDNIGVK